MGVSQLLKTHPAESVADLSALSTCIDECVACAEVCVGCADACLAEDNVSELTRCITLDLVCADVCTTTGATLTRQTAFDAGLARRIVETCIEACNRCGDECEKHAEHHEHCRLCAEACRRCVQACDELLSVL